MKKWIMVAAVVAGLLVLLFGKDAVSYVATSIGLARERTDDSIPTAFHLRRAADLSQKLDGEIEKLIRRYSEEQLRIEALEKREADGTDAAALAKLKGQIVALRQALQAKPPEKEAVKDEKDQKAAGKEPASNTPEQRLTMMFKQYRAREEAMKARHSAIVTGRKALVQIEEKLRLLRADQERLASEILRVEARLELAKSNGASPDAFDTDTRKRIEGILKAVETRIEVAERTEENKRALGMATGANEEPPSDQIGETIDQYFKEPAAGN